MRRLAVTAAAAVAALAAAAAADATFPGPVGPIAYSIQIPHGLNDFGDTTTAPAERDVCLADPATATTLRLRGGATSIDPAWSPDGSRIAYVRVGPAGTAYLETMAADGSDVRQLYPDVAHAAAPAWAPDGIRLAFEDQGRSGVVVGRADGTGTPRLLLLQARTPDWSPLGSLLALTTTGIDLVTPEGAVVSHVGPTLAATPSWSPDGSRLAFAALVSETNGIRHWAIDTIRADGGDLRQVATADAFDPPAPVWSPDGTQLAYAAFAPFGSDPRWRGQDDIDVVSAAGGTPRDLTSSPLDERSPSWGVRGSSTPSVQASARPCVVAGTEGADRLAGSSADDRIFGLAGNDAIAAGAGNDLVWAGAGNDVVSGGAGNDSIEAGAGNDRVVGGAGRDVILGGAGNDTILARDGARDTISCGRGRDLVVADRIDRISRDCERVRRPKR